MHSIKLSEAICEATVNILVSMVLTLLMVAMFMIYNVDAVENSKIIISICLAVNFIQLIVVRLCFQKFKK